MLEKLFVSKVRIKLLKLFLYNPDEAYHVRGLTREIDEEINAVRRELERMSKIKFLRSERKGNRLLYMVRKDFPLFNELLAMIYKEFGLGEKLITNYKNIGDVKFCWLTKFYTKRIAKTDKDVDLVLIGDDLNYDLLANIVKDAEKETGRQINYTVMGEQEFTVRKQRGDAFVMNLLLSSRVMLVGDEDKMLS